MGRDLRFLVVNRDEALAGELRALLQKVEGVKVIAELDEPAILAQAVKQFPIEVVFVNLDPAPESILPLVGEIATTQPDLIFFATSSSSDGQLILKAMRTGVREFFPKPIEVKNVREAVEKIASQRADATPQGQLISVMGTSGGVGATVLAVNLAVELAEITKGEVVLVDLDYRFGQIATLLDVEPNYTLADLCNSPERLEPSVIKRALIKHRSGVQVLSRPNTFVQADTITAASCVGLLSSLLQMSEYVIADGPSRFDPGARSAVDLADHAFLVLQLLVPHVRNGARMLESMRENGQNLGRVKLACNRVGRDAGHLSVDDVAQTLNLSAFASIPDDWPTVSGAINLGEPLASYSPKSKVRLAIQEIAQRLHSREATTDDKDSRRKGLMGRLFATSAAG